MKLALPRFFLNLFLLLAMNFTGCANIESRMESVDRSLVSSPLMSFNQNDLDKISPFTGLRGNATVSSGSCSVCAH